MKPNRFLIQFFLFVLIFGGILFGGVHQMEPFSENQLLSLIGFIFFSIYTIGIYYLGKYAGQSTNKTLFTQIHLMSIFFKMLLTIVLLLVYRKFYEPDSAYYILPFILIYVAFTIHETYVMMRISKADQI